MKDRPELGNVFEEFAKEMRNHFRNTLRYVEHPLELGVAREKLLVDYLSRLIPERFGIGTGFVVDSKGNRSKQIDVIIYDKIISPVFEVPGHIQFFPCECVVVVGEVKSTITDRKTLCDALEKIKSVQTLNRFNDFRNIEVAVHGAHGHCKLDPPDNEMVPINYRILGFIFTSSALLLNTMIDELKKYFADNPMSVWPNLVASFDEYLVSYSKQRKSLELFPDDADELYATIPEEIDRVIPTFGALIANFLTVVRVVRPELLNYLGMQQSKVVRFPIK